jgi:hypothetical protein
MTDPTRNKFSRGPFVRFNPRPPFSFNLPQGPLFSPNEIHDRLRFQQRIAAIGSKPARDLTQQEARDLTAYYALTGQITLAKQVTFDPYGKPEYPKPNEKVAVGSTIAGVSFIPANADPAKWPTTRPLDMRLVVLLVRLSQYLHVSPWGVTIIYWGGLGIQGDETQPLDRHGKGFALDFHGAVTRRGKYMVLQDWWNRPITLPNGKPAPHNQWPVNVQPYYRLDVDDPSGAGGFFYDVYHFLTGEAADGFNPAKPTSIGDHSRILHPDHPDPNLRYPHRDHIHTEIDR